MSSTDPDGVQITTAHNGPYLVKGPITLIDDGETPIPTSAGRVVALCRCGRSDTKPFCDGTHAKVGFDGTIAR